MSADPSYRKRPDAIGEIYVRSEKGEMIPLKALANVWYSAGPDSLDRFNNLPAVKLLGQGAHGVSSGQAIQVVEQIAKESAASGFQLRLGRCVVSRKARKRHFYPCAGARGGDGVPNVSPRYTSAGRCPFSVLLALPFGTFGRLGGRLVAWSD
jgi:hypothetical protein